MSWQTSRKIRLTQVGTAIIAALAVQSGYAREDIMDTTGLADYIAGSTDVQPLKDYGVTWGGWLQASITANANAPQDGYNGTMTFNDRANQVQMNQVYFYLQKAITVSGDEWDWGGRFDGMYGSDSIFTQAYGTPYQNQAASAYSPYNRGNWDLNLGSHNNLYNAFALPQAYASLNIPFGNGVDLKVGHFYTPVGYEVVTAPDNFFMSKPYTFQYGEPFTHTGFLANYALDENWTISGGGVTGSGTGGWDGSFNTQLGNWSFLGGTGWTSDDKAYSLNLTGTAGNQSYSQPGSNNFWGIYSLVGKANWLDDDLHYVIQHDHGYANNVWNENALNVNAQWYGINQYLTYDIEDNLGVGLRAEWFRDANGYRVQGPARCGASTNYDSTGTAQSYSCASQNPASGSGLTSLNSPYVGSTAGWGNNMGGGANYYELTAGLNYKPLKWVILRPNARYDFSQGASMYMGSNGQMLDYQFTFSFDATVVF